MKAVEKQDVSMERFLIAKGVDVNCYVDGEITVLQNVIYHLNQAALTHTETAFVEI